MNQWEDAARESLVMFISGMSASDREQWLANVEKHRYKCQSGRAEIDALLREVRAIMAAYPPKS